MSIRICVYGLTWKKCGGQFLTVTETGMDDDDDDDGIAGERA